MFDFRKPTFCLEKQQPATDPLYHYFIQPMMYTPPHRNERFQLCLLQLIFVSYYYCIIYYYIILYILLSQRDKYRITVEASDRGTPVRQWSRVVIIISIIDVNDNPPIFSHSNYTAQVQVCGPNQSLSNTPVSDCQSIRYIRSPV